MSEYKAYLQRLVAENSNGRSLSLQTENIVDDVFRSLSNYDGTIDIDDAAKLIFRLNSRLGRNYNDDDIQAFYDALDSNDSKKISLEEFKNALTAI